MWLRRVEYARRYGVSLATVDRWIRQRRVQVYRVGKVVRIWDAPPREPEREPEAAKAAQ